MALLQSWSWNFSDWPGLLSHLHRLLGNFLLDNSGLGEISDIGELRDVPHLSDGDNSGLGQPSHVGNIRDLELRQQSGLVPAHSEHGDGVGVEYSREGLTEGLFWLLDNSWWTGGGGADGDRGGGGGDRGRGRGRARGGGCRGGGGGRCGRWLNSLSH